jgi:DNA-binding transcriptional LysR family regulator
MDRLASMRAFVKVVEAGSFVRAAERLGISNSSLSQRISELEQHLGARLLNRTTRSLSLTDTGQSYYERCVQLLADLDEADAMAGQSQARPRGVIRLTCSYNIGQKRIAPAIAAFVEKYSDVQFDVVVSDRIVDLVDEGFDLAVRVGSVGSEQQVARKIGSTDLVLCASPAYLKRHGTLISVHDIVQHRALTYAYSPTPRIWRFRDQHGEVQDIKVNGSLHANSGDVLVAAAVSGLGLVYEPCFLVAEALADGTLVRVLPACCGMSGDIWAVYPTRRHLSVKVRLFVEHLASSFGDLRRSGE